MRLHPAVLLLPALFAVACSSSNNNARAPTRTTTASAPTVAAATAATTPGKALTPTEVFTPRSTAAPTVLATTAPKDEAAFAKQLLLTVNEFPAGYTEKPSTSQTSAVSKLCPAPDSTGQTGKAQTGDFTPNNGNTSVTEALGVYDSAERADAAFSVAIGVGDCIAKAINAGKLDDSKTAYSGATFSPVSFPRFGDRSNAYRLQFHAKIKGQTGFGSEADGFLDLIYVREGRVAYSVLAQDILTPFDSTLLQQVVTRADATVRRGLGLPSSTATPQ